MIIFGELLFDGGWVGVGWVVEVVMVMFVFLLAEIGGVFGFVVMVIWFFVV